MKLLLDTHAFLWFVQGSESLSRRAGDALLDERNVLLFSAASYWEICIKVSLGKLELGESWAAVFDREMRINAIAWLEAKKEHFRGVIELPFIHRDPFDRLLVAQALHERCAVVTHDPRFGEYGVKQVW